jgi:hypothetical protein
MRRKPAVTTDHEATTIRIAWWASFLATLALIALLGIAKSAQALTLSDPAPTGTFPAVVPALAEEEVDEGEAEASEDEELEAEECVENEEEECEEAEDGAAAPAECLLSSAEATIFAASNRDRVRLQLRYTSNAPTPVALAYGLHGSKGSLYLGGEKKRFARRGVLHLDRSLTEPQMAKVMAARSFTVRLRVLDTPDYCQSFFERQLDVRRATPSGLSWQQSE